MDAPAPAKPSEGSAPDLNVNVGPAGRETLAAIAEELAGAARAAVEPHAVADADTPGRTTLTALAEAIAPGSAPPRRERRTTRGYESRPDIPSAPRDGRAPRSATPAPTGSAVRPNNRPPAAVESGTQPQGPPVPQPTAPQPPVVQTDDIRIDVRPAGRETMAAIEDELAREQGESAGEPAPTPTADSGGYEIFEMATFVVRGGDLARLSSQAERRQFVTQRLMHRLPVDDPELVDRIDVTPWTVRGTVIVRVWCRVPAG